MGGSEKFKFIHCSTVRSRTFGVCETLTQQENQKPKKQNQNTHVTCRGILCSRQGSEHKRLSVSRRSLEIADPGHWRSLLSVLRPHLGLEIGVLVI